MIYGTSLDEARPNSTSVGEDPLGLPIDPDEAHRSDCMVTVDMPLSMWGETKPTIIGHHDLSRLVGMPRKIGVRSP